MMQTHEVVLHGGVSGGIPGPAASGSAAIIRIEPSKPEDFSSLQAIENQEVFRADAEKLVAVLTTSLPGGTFEHALAIMRTSSVVDNNTLREMSEVQSCGKHDRVLDGEILPGGAALPFAAGCKDCLRLMAQVAAKGALSE